MLWYNLYRTGRPTAYPNPIIIGIDLAERTDHSAVAVIENPVWVPDSDGIEDLIQSGYNYASVLYGWEPGWHLPTEFPTPKLVSMLRYVALEFGQPLPPVYLTHLERLPIGMPAREVCAYIDNLYARVERFKPHLVVDITGVGSGIVNMWAPHHAHMTQVFLHAGQTVNNVDGRGRRLNVPVVDLVSSTKVLLENGRLKISRGIKDFDALKHEILSFRRKINKNTAHESYSAWRESDHDDTVFALSLASFYRQYIAAAWDRTFEREGAPPFYPTLMPNQTGAWLDEYDESGLLIGRRPARGDDF